MGDEVIFLECPGCHRLVGVMWAEDGLSGPRFCPLCGGDLDYSAEKSQPDTGKWERDER